MIDIYIYIYIYIKGTISFLPILMSDPNHKNAYKASFNLKKNTGFNLNIY